MDPETQNSKQKKHLSSIIYLYAAILAAIIIFAVAGRIVLNSYLAGLNDALAAKNIIIFY